MTKELRTPFFITLFIFIGLFVFLKIFGPLAFSVSNVTTTKESLFTVEGSGEIVAIPDTALLTLGVTKTASTVTSAQNQVNEAITQITANLKKLGVEDKNIKTTNYSVNPNYDWTSSRQTITGYTVNASMEVKLKPIDQANNAIDIATKNGANQVGNIQFVLDEQKQKELENQARTEAIKNAKENAHNISREAGIRLGKVVDVKENSYQTPRPLSYAAMKAEDASSGNSTQLNPGENKVSINVTLSYETY
jgi:uncharacterized protein